MNRDEVMTLVREHLAEELEVDPGSISEATRFKDDLDADSLDLYELVMELEDRYGITVSEQDAARIETVGDAVAFVLDQRTGLSEWVVCVPERPPMADARASEHGNRSP